MKCDSLIHFFTQKYLLICLFCINSLALLKTKILHPVLYILFRLEVKGQTLLVFCSMSFITIVRGKTKVHRARRFDYLGI